MKRTIKLTESKLRDMIQKAVNGAMTQRRPMRKTQSKRLTENRLRDMIKESVSSALNELDARTYASAAKKAREKGDDRSSKFKKAAKNAWDRDYGTSSYSSSGEFPKTTYYDDVYYLGGDDTDDKYIPTHDYQSYSMADGDYGSIKYDPDFSCYDKLADEKIEWATDFPEDKHIAKFGRGMKVAKQMTNGTGKYIKGKGWQ